MSEQTSTPISPLVAALISASLAQTQQTTTYLIDTLTAQLADQDAELDAIRAGVLELLDGDYMPTPAAIQRALYPSDKYVDKFRDGSQS